MLGERCEIFKSLILDGLPHVQRLKLDGETVFGIPQIENDWNLLQDIHCISASENSRETAEDVFVLISPFNIGPSNLLSPHFWSEGGWVIGLWIFIMGKYQINKVLAHDLYKLWLFALEYFEKKLVQVGIQAGRTIGTRGTTSSKLAMGPLCFLLALLFFLFFLKFVHLFIIRKF